MVRRRVGVGRLPKWWCLVSARATIVTTDDFGIRDAVDGVGATCLSVSRSSGRDKKPRAIGQSACATHTIRRRPSPTGFLLRVKNEATSRHIEQYQFAKSGWE